MSNISAINFTTKHKLTKADTKGNSLERAFSIGEDAKGNIWVGTVESGVWRYDGNAVKNFAKDDGLESNHIWTIYKSKQGELWFGGNGVYRFNGANFTQFTTENGLTSNVVLSIMEDDKGQIWCGTWQGLCIFDGEKFVNANIKEAWTM